MKQVVQNLKSGSVLVDEVPSPQLQPEGILVRTRMSLISAGTERTMLQLSRKTVAGKARERPDLVRKVLKKLRRDGLWATLASVQDRLDRDVAVGYSIAGDVIAVGGKAAEFSVGEPVACAGAGYASHAEVNYVPRLLACAVPPGVSTEAAAYATVGAIALQGVRHANAQVGETVVVIGLGLLGQLATQLLKAAGCRVVGLDLNQQRVDLAAQYGADLSLNLRDGSEQQVIQFTRGRGADAVLITAATKSNAPVEMAARLARAQGRVVMVGVTGMNLPRRAYYEKELSFVVSRSYGPGRHDREYEEKGHDYPAGYVRWTEQRNLESFLDLVAAGKVCPEALTTHRMPIDDAADAYEMVLTNQQPFLGILLQYPEQQLGSVAVEPARILLPPRRGDQLRGDVAVSFVGAGSFARSVLLPALLADRRAKLRGVVTSSGLSAKAAARKFGFAYCASSATEIVADQESDIIFVATRHAQHADDVCRALRAGKPVFVEKPLAVSLQQLANVQRALQEHNAGLMVGFNRRFAPLAEALKDHLSGCGPLSVQYRCNAGSLPEEHWLRDPDQGGRIIGEACHFFDLFSFLTESRPQRVTAVAVDGASTDDALITVDYADGSVCQLAYVTMGPDELSKERVEVCGGGRAAVLDDFRRLDLYGAGRTKRFKRMRGDKGHAEELRRVLSAIASQDSLPIDVNSLLDTTLTSLAAVKSIRTGEAISIESLRERLSTLTCSEAST